jgi:hypothetical protein
VFHRPVSRCFEKRSRDPVQYPGNAAIGSGPESLCRHRGDGRQRRYSAYRGRREEKTDHVVLAVGVRSNDKLALELAPHFPRLYTIGDARKVGRIAQAVRDGFDTVWKLV